MNLVIIHWLESFMKKYGCHHFKLPWILQQRRPGIDDWMALCFFFSIYNITEKIQIRKIRYKIFVNLYG